MRDGNPAGHKTTALAGEFGGCDLRQPFSFASIAHDGRGGGLKIRLWIGSTPFARTKAKNLIGKGLVCKTSVGAFDSPLGLQFGRVAKWQSAGFRHQKGKPDCEFESRRAHHVNPA